MNIIIKKSLQYSLRFIIGTNVSHRTDDGGQMTEARGRITEDGFRNAEGENWDTIGGCKPRRKAREDKIIVNLTT